MFGFNQYWKKPPWIPVSVYGTAGIAGVYYNPETKVFFEAASSGGVSSSNTIKQGDPRYNDLWKKHQKNIQNYITIQNGGIRPNQLFKPTAGSSTLGPSSGAKGKTLAYPKEKVGDDSYFTSKDTDYIIFEFGEYIPPFGKDLGAEQKDTAGKVTRARVVESYDLYQLSSNLKPQDVTYANHSNEGNRTSNRCILPIPQDLSTEIKQNWEAKSFSAIGVAAIKAAEGDLSRIPESIDNSDVLTAAAAAIKSSVLNSIPGVGGNISLNDILGATRGLIINPNAEMLYDSPDLREIAMSFKMIARSKAEAVEIQSICNWFRTASLPRWGSGENVDPASLIGKEADELVSGDNFLRVPYLCKFTFMKGSDPHPYLAQYKPCAVTGIEVNYTPDGTYATYSDGAPVATELRIRFAETKLIFQQDMVNGKF